MLKTQQCKTDTEVTGNLIATIGVLYSKLFNEKNEEIAKLESYVKQVEGKNEENFRLEAKRCKSDTEKKEKMVGKAKKITTNLQTKIREKNEEITRLSA